MQETWFWFLAWGCPLEKEMATHSSILAWEIPWTEEPGRLQATGSQKSQTRFSNQGTITKRWIWNTIENYAHSSHTYIQKKHLVNLWINWAHCQRRKILKIVKYHLLFNKLEYDDFHFFVVYSCTFLSFYSNCVTFTTIRKKCYYLRKVSRRDSTLSSTWQT